MGTGALSMEEKLQGRKSDHSPPSTDDVKNNGAIPPLPIRLYGIVLNYIIKNRDNFKFLLIFIYLYILGKQ
jgi:hypothetical protein